MIKKEPTLTAAEEKTLNPSQKRRILALRQAEFSIEKIFPPEIEKLREDFGPDSKEFKDAVGTFEGKKFTAEDQQRDLVNKFQQNTMKFLSGEFSMTEAEAKGINELFAPEREIVSKFEENQNELFEKGIKEFTEKTIKDVSERAVASGRDPLDPEFQNQIAGNVARETTTGKLALESDILNRKQDLAQRASSLRLQQLTGGGGVTTQSAQLSDAINQQRLLNLQGVGGTVQGQSNSLAALRTAQPTTTGSTTPSPLEIGLGVGSLFLGGATGFATAAALRQMANAQQR